MSGAVPLQHPTLKGNWVEERAVQSEDPIHDIVALSKNGHKDILKFKGSGNNYETTFETTFGVRNTNTLSKVGKRREKLQARMLEMAKQEPMKIEENTKLRTTYMDYCDKTVEHKPIAPSNPHPISFWSEYAIKGSSIYSTSDAKLVHDNFCKKNCKVGHSSGQVHQKECSGGFVWFGRNDTFSTPIEYNFK